MKANFARLFGGAALVVGFTFTAPVTASAQGIGFVIQGNFADDVDFGVGGGVNFDVGASDLRAEATFDYYFPDGSDYWEINGNVLMDIASTPGLYVGAGVNLADSFDSGGAGGNEIGLNLLGGYSFGGEKAPFVQAKFEAGGGEQLVVSAGIRI
jgi:hypothetical protein